MWHQQSHSPELLGRGPSPSPPPQSSRNPTPERRRRYSISEEERLRLETHRRASWAGAETAAADELRTERDTATKAMASAIAVRRASLSRAGYESKLRLLGLLKNTRDDLGHGYSPPYTAPVLADSDWAEAATIEAAARRASNAEEEYRRYHHYHLQQQQQQQQYMDHYGARRGSYQAQPSSLYDYDHYRRLGPSSPYSMPVSYTPPPPPPPPPAPGLPYSPDYSWRLPVPNAFCHSPWCPTPPVQSSCCHSNHHLVQHNGHNCGRCCGGIGCGGNGCGGNGCGGSGCGRNGCGGNGCGGNQQSSKSAEEEKAAAAAAAKALEERELQIAMLQKQIESLGEQPIKEMVSLEVAKERAHAAGKLIMDGDDSMATENEYEKWDNFIRNHPEFIKEKEEAAKAWEESNKEINRQALQTMRSFIPPNIFDSSLNSLVADGLPPQLAKRLFEKKVLWLLRAPEDAISKVHVVELRRKYAADGLDLRELRALYSCLPARFMVDPDGQRQAWRNEIKSKLMRLVEQERDGKLKGSDLIHDLYQNVEGPYDPDAEFIPQSVVSCTAYDPTERPEVSSIDAEKIAAIREKLVSPVGSPRDGGSRRASTGSAFPRPISPAAISLSRRRSVEVGADSMNSLMGELKEAQSLKRKGFVEDEEGGESEGVEDGDRHELRRSKRLELEILPLPSSPMSSDMSGETEKEESPVTAPPPPSPMMLPPAQPAIKAPSEKSTERRGSSSPMAGVLDELMLKRKKVMMEVGYDQEEETDTAPPSPPPMMLPPAQPAIKTPSEKSTERRGSLSPMAGVLDELMRKRKAMKGG